MLCARWVRVRVRAEHGETRDARRVPCGCAVGCWGVRRVRRRAHVTAGRTSRSVERGRVTLDVARRVAFASVSCTSLVTPAPPLVGRETYAATIGSRDHPRAGIGVHPRPCTGGTAATVRVVSQRRLADAFRVSDVIQVTCSHVLGFFHVFMRHGSMDNACAPERISVFGVRTAPARSRGQSPALRRVVISSRVACPRLRDRSAPVPSAAGRGVPSRAPAGSVKRKRCRYLGPGTVS